jgi:serine/threonine-protein kinase SRPK3
LYGLLNFKVRNINKFRCNLLDILKRYNYEGVPMDICQEISRQVLIGLDYLHRICGVIHTDLKPENVMVCLSAE